MFKLSLKRRESIDVHERNRSCLVAAHNVATPMEKYTSINFGRRMRWYIDLETKKCC